MIIQRQLAFLSDDDCCNIYDGFARRDGAQKSLLKVVCWAEQKMNEERLQLESQESALQNQAKADFFRQNHADFWNGPTPNCS